ncbi:MAG: entericidin A/B family lipoprotein [Dongiaceae bacterium]
MTRFLSWRARGAALALLLMGGLTLAACNTAEGFGQDVKNTGEQIKDAAD